MKKGGEKVGQAVQDKSGSFFSGPGLGSIKTGKKSGSTMTSSAASPSKLKTGTREGVGGTQKPFSAKADTLTHTPSNRQKLGKA